MVTSGVLYRRHGSVWTLCYVADVSENVSVRLEDGLAQRLRLRARAAGETLSDRLRRYADEGVRRDEHPLVTFRDGPTGRRAGLVGGPDVWEVVDTLLTVREHDPDLAEAALVSATAEAIALPERNTRIAVRYYAAYPEEIDERVEANRQAARE